MNKSLRKVSIFKFRVRKKLMEWETLAWVQRKILKEHGRNYCFEGIITCRALVFLPWFLFFGIRLHLLHMDALCFAVGRSSGEESCHSLACFLSHCASCLPLPYLILDTVAFWMWMKGSTLVFETLWKMLWCFCFLSKGLSTRASCVLILICWILSVSTSELYSQAWLFHSYVILFVTLDFCFRRNRR